MFSIAAVVMCGLVAGITVPLIQSDLRSRRLPNALVLPGYLALTVVSAEDWARTGGPPLAMLGSGALWFGMFCLAALTGGLGMGDVKLGGLLGASLGLISWQFAAAGLVFVGFGSGVAGAFVLLRRNRMLPFGAAATLGAVARFGAVARLGVVARSDATATADAPWTSDSPAARNSTASPNQCVPFRAGLTQFPVPADPNGFDVATNGIPLGPILLGAYWAAVAGAAALVAVGRMPL
ncbi:prepilin peptidase [Lysinibacter cavernae]|uniref:Flp pilus assembly protein protease CpaA n=1 Tax=Lysinibacter cavernae TaxID=1640652 RepID=A0A7X5R0K9_9MICO|nr:A24 family peptidase [Lysinibacter cavernae]NIH53475.1 Flp pilus assembly protein protease CpaA [Lysinibacter cavernae]